MSKKTALILAILLFAKSSVFAGGGTDFAPDSPMTESELIEEAIKNGSVQAEFFPSGDGVNYMRPKKQNEALVWDSTPVEYKYAITNLCQDSRGGVKCMVVRDCLSFWEPINDEKYGELCFEKTGTKLDVYGIAGFGIEDGLLYPIYYLRTGGYIRGIDIAPLSSLIFARSVMRTV